jgi:pimeloyl-ACP methyl ester carboxylesterase
MRFQFRRKGDMVEMESHLGRSGRAPASVRRRRRSLVVSAALAAATFVSVLPQIGLHFVSAATWTGCATSDFETGTEGWGSWWTGNVDTSSAFSHHGGASLHLSGNPGSAQRTLRPSECGAALSSATFFLRTGTGTQRTYVKTIDQITGAARLTGPYAVSSSWEPITVDLSTANPTNLSIESYGTGTNELFLDELSIAHAGGTVPPTTSQPASPGCASGFEDGADGWSSWWAGQVALSNATALSGVSSLRVSGMPATAHRAVSPAACGASGFTMWVRTLTGRQSVFVKVVDASTGTSSVNGPYVVDNTWQPISVNIGPNNATVGVEAYGNGTTDLFVDDAALTQGVVPTTGSPTTVAPVATAAPTTVAPTTTAPTTVATATVAPTTIAPTTIAPTTIAPTTIAPTTIAPTTIAPTTVAPTTNAPPVNGNRCLVFLHGMGGTGSAIYRNDNVWWVQPAGNYWAAGGLSWDYVTASGFVANVANIRAQISAAGCGQVVLVGFSNGGGLASRTLCSGETFGGRLVGVILDDPVVDSAPLGCSNAAGVQVAMLYTSWMAGIGAQGGACDPGWVCLGNRMTVTNYASAVGASAVLKNRGHEPEPDYQARVAGFWR